MTQVKEETGDSQGPEPQTPGHAKINRKLRNEAKNVLYPPTTPSQWGVLNDFLNTFSRFAGNQRTAFENGAGLSASSASGNALELKVERAFTQVLGRAVGGLRSTNNFMKALNAAFPTTPDGRVVDTPQRGVISLYSTDGSSNPLSNSVLDGLVGQLSTKQAILYREASLVAGDFLKILEGLETFVPEADKEEVEALRALIRSEISILVEEFGRVDEPRATRVHAYLTALKSNLDKLKSRGFFEPKEVTIISDETQTAGFFLLEKYAVILQDIWTSFTLSETAHTKSLSEQVERANVLLPIIAQGNVDFQAALISVAFTESEQRSLAAKFTMLDGTLLHSQENILKIITADNTQSMTIESMPDITVRDLVDWLDRFAKTEGPIRLPIRAHLGLTAYSMRQISSSGRLYQSSGYSDLLTQLNRPVGQC